MSHANFRRTEHNTGERERNTTEVVVHVAKLFTAGTAAGLAECVASYPLDTIKTRMQTQGGSAGVLASFAKAIREDGLLTLYRGMSSRLVANMCVASVMFGTNGTLKEFFGAEPHKPITVPFMAAAALTGAMEAIVYCPFELVKTRMQVVLGAHAGVTTWSAAVTIYRQYGLVKGLYRGIWPLTLRESVGNLGYFTSYEYNKQALAGNATGEGRRRLGIAGAGGVAGMVYTVVVQPIDTIKSLVQTDSLATPQYRGFVDGLRQAIAGRGGGIRGFAGLYRGLSPALARAFVGNAALFLTLETTMDALGR